MITASRNAPDWLTALTGNLSRSIVNLQSYGEPTLAELDRLLLTEQPTDAEIVRVRVLQQTLNFTGRQLVQRFNALTSNGMRELLNVYGAFGSGGGKA